ncbi:hypothetical protein SPBR_03467 [Sporothrix brasiliensis 5110]|uniref:Uncharacterized protein n=1 Tax=Sporothrix brasiliensis 5110 TaxID=1398154 RepID=A0A0C2J179_9PEZI|nr:uncharacterized protein SPBR_03467 [Sporothrix brasiliensis 5110]KIH95096.1 hypothetical protein SPBR_03467 [Sporothrix brasiliensis 5110]
MHVSTSAANSHMASTVESWVEVASQPSSSSLSSIADEIVITGLRVGSGATGINGGAMPATPQRRRRLLQQVEAAGGPLSPSSSPSSTRPPTSHPTTHPTSSPSNTAAATAAAPRSLAGSSQEEYDETESEEDRVLSSSAENLELGLDAGRPPAQSYALLQYQAAADARLRQRAAASDGDDEEDGDGDGDGDNDDDDEGTALGMPSSGPPTFRPQPNAFSHPPTHLQHPSSHRSLPTPRLSQMPPHMAAGDGPYAPYAPRSSRPARNSAPSFMSPAYREDNDAALRASLTTLLSCAAAARRLPKAESSSVRTGGAPSASTTTATAATAATATTTTTANAGLCPSNQLMGLRLVPESELMGDDHDANDDASVSPRTRTPFSRPSAAAAPVKQQHQHHSSRNGAVSAVSAVSASSKSKRIGASKASPRVTKKKRTSSSSAAAAAATNDAAADVTMISPTLLTWVVSAGVVVLVSVVGFGAGFVIGREVGRQEAAAAASAAASSSSSSLAMASAANGSASASTACGREIMRSSTGSTLRRFRWGEMTKSVAA